MNQNSRYYTGYEENDDDDDDENLSDNESNSDDEETEKKFKNYLQTTKQRSNLKKGSKKTVKSLADSFEAEMNQELDDIIESEHANYISEVTKLKSNVDMPQKTKEDDVDEEDTDSEAELETGVRTTKKRPKYTNDELFYDPEADDQDEIWLNKQRGTSKNVATKSPLKSILKQPSTSESKISEDGKVDVDEEAAPTDAVLNCPCCFTMLTMDCQRHEEYKTQYRAMFVFNCKINKDEVLKYALNSDQNFSNNRNKKTKKTKRPIREEDSEKPTTSSSNNSGEEKLFEIYRPVLCEKCGVEVGVYHETDELYHFFNVLASHS